MYHFRCMKFKPLVIRIWNQNIAISTIVGTSSHNIYICVYISGIIAGINHSSQLLYCDYHPIISTGQPIIFSLDLIIIEVTNTSYSGDLLQQLWWMVNSCNYPRYIYTNVCIPVDFLNMATKWLVTFNTQKTETMTISRKIDKPDVTILESSNWTFSIFLLSDILMLSHITSAYSNRGLTNKHLQIYTIITHAMLLLFPSSVHEPHCITIPSFHLPFDCGMENLPKATTSIIIKWFWRYIWF
jgi:hypothetical protein